MNFLIQALHKGLKPFRFSASFALLALTFASASSLSAATIDDLKFTLINGDTEYSVAAKEPTSIAGALDIPATYNGKPVTEIAQLGFGIEYAENADYPDITSISIPSSIKVIGKNAFQQCTLLTTVTFAEGSQLTAIPDYAFESCFALTSITLPNSITKIGIGAFGSCEALTSIILPDSLTSIEFRAFYFCKKLTSITLPDTVTSMGDSIFEGCLALTSATLSKSLTSISQGAFTYCSALTSITIPDSVTSIGISAFDTCTALTSITLPASLTSIGGNAFYYSGLTTVTIPASVTSIGNFAFYQNEQLATVTFLGQAPTLDFKFVFYLAGSGVQGGLIVHIHQIHEASFTAWRESNPPGLTFNVIKDSNATFIYARTNYNPSNKAFSIITAEEDSAVTLVLQHKASMTGTWADLSTLAFTKATDSNSGAVTRTITIDPSANPTGFYRLVPQDNTN